MNEAFMREAIRQSKEGMDRKEGGPFGAIVVKDGKIIGRGNNRVLTTNDPTAHAEVVAIRDACKNLGAFQLDDCDIYTSCEPCPMCLGAIYWARPKRVFFGCTRTDAADIEFDDDFIYKEITVPLDQRQIPMIPLLREEALVVFKEWQENPDKTLY
ncbi:MAG TPA: nucleoside deaminase [Saprospiraceae bacterium]|nr:nucleoside deaminase [Saprospiraceae bacterium]HPI06983.1 nucleoside deaminase [Saprospiraceae bacterium]